MWQVFFFINCKALHFILWFVFLCLLKRLVLRSIVTGKLGPGRRCRGSHPHPLLMEGWQSRRAAGCLRSLGGGRPGWRERNGALLHADRREEDRIKWQQRFCTIVAALIKSGWLSLEDYTEISSLSSLAPPFPLALWWLLWVWWQVVMAGLALIWGAVLERQHVLKPEMLGNTPFLAADVFMLGPSSSWCLVPSMHESNH